MLTDVHIGWLAWSLLDQLKEGTVNTDQILQLINLLLPILVPLILSGVKMIVPKLPKPIIPVLAPVLGAILGGITQGNPVAGATLGLAGVGVREVVDQAKKSTNP